MTRTGRPQKLFIATQARSEATAQVAIAHVITLAKEASMHVSQTGRSINPGTMPNAHGPGITPVLLQTLSFHDVTCQATLQRCIAPLRAIHLTTSGTGSLIQVFGSEDFSNAVLIPIPVQAIPAAFEGIRSAVGAFPVAVAVLPGGIVVNGVRPGYQRAFMEVTGIEQWLRTANTPH